jgi:hypothetical protein
MGGSKVRRIFGARALPFRAQQGLSVLWVTAASIALTFAAPAGVLRSQNSSAGEYQVKAAFLFHFAQFIDWPPDVFKDAESPVTYCTIGDDPFRGALDASLNGKTLGLRPMRVRHLKEPQEIQGCQVLYIAGDEKKAISAVLATVEGSPTLTVGESERFAQEGGMIGFCLDDNKIRFEINLRAAERAKLKISARLLTLAKTVIGGPKGD